MRIQVAILAFMLSAPVVARSQDRTDFTRLQKVLKQKDELAVMRSDGTKVKGRLTDISTERILLSTKAGPVSLMEPEITKVQRKQNGVLLGTLIGAGAALPLALAANEYASNEGGGSAAGLIMGLGIVAGLATDALIPSMKTVYKRSTKPHVTVQPIINRSQAGGRVAFKF